MFYVFQTLHWLRDSFTLYRTLAGLLPEGTLGVRRTTFHISAGGTKILDGFRDGLYMLKNNSESHSIGVAIMFADGNAVEIVEDVFIKATERSGTVYLKKNAVNEPVSIHNDASSGKSISITYISFGI